MAYPELHISNGPAQRDLELAFVGRNLGARARFTVFLNNEPIEVELRIYNFQFFTCQGPNYTLGGQLVSLSAELKHQLPSHNWISVEYNTEKRSGSMEFSNAE